MKRDNELIRQLLLLVEDQGDDVHDWIEDIVLDGFSEEQISHHVWLLANGGFIESIDLSALDGSCWRPRCLTYKGHEFLDATRNRDVWEKTLGIAKSLGDQSLSAIFDISKALVRKKIEKHLDLAS